jgi:hypothetical protein
MTKPIEDKLAHAKREIKALKGQLVEAKQQYELLEASAQDNGDLVGITVEIINSIWQEGFDAENFDDRDYCQPLMEAIIAIEEASPPSAVVLEWVSMQDQSPPIIAKCLGWNAKANKILGPATYRIFVACAENTSDISHWMLLPEPPKQEPTQ